jgi:hypothetical protein
MAWTQQGSLKGPKGDTGETGLQGIQGIQGVKGDKGDTGDQGVQGVQGVQGTAGVDGAGVSLAGEVATYANLPSNLTNTNADRGKGYLVTADGKLYVWTGTSFPSDGNGVDFRGTQGIQGIQGVQGVKGDTGDQGIQGVKGDTGSTGETGSAGARGTLWFSGAGAPSGVGGSQPGDFYLDTQTGTFYLLS